MPVSVSDYCNNIATNNPVPLAGERRVGTAMFVVSLCYFISSVVVVYFIKRKEKEAQTDRYESNASNSVIFPVFVNILWANAMINIYVGLVITIFSYSTLYDDDLWAYGLMYGLQHVVTEGIAFMLMRKGVGWKAAKESFVTALCWGAITLLVKLGVGTPNWLPYHEYFKQVSFGLNLFWEICLLVFYWTLWMAPKKLLFRRPAAIFYSKFWAIFRLLVMVNDVLVYVPNTSTFGKCFNVYGILLPFSIMEPIVVYFTLLQDSRWWQGISIRHIFSSSDRLSMESNESARNLINTPLHGVDLNQKSAQSLAAQIDLMSSGSKSIKLLNFSQIVLDKQTLLGSGSFSRVYKGLYRQKQCAVKLIYTLDLTEDVIKRVAAEAQILSEIEHPNIVQIFGVSVLPPSVCILLELCQFGSLADVIGSGSTRGLKLHLADKLYLALGCAKGLSALHNWSHELCHRDIKSFNFLVDAQLNAKLADLELGVTATQRNPNLNPNRESESKRNTFRMDSLNENDLEDGIENIELNSEEQLANWMAPEIISGESNYKQYSDIYSFALVLWEILSGQHPFSDIFNQDTIRSMVCEGRRPAIPDELLDSGPPMNHFVALIERCWQNHPKMRPTASEVLSELECIYSNVCHALVVDTDVFPNISVADLVKKRPGGKGMSIWSPEIKANNSNAVLSPFLDTPDFSISNLSNVTTGIGAVSVADLTKEGAVVIDRFYEKVEAVIKDTSYALIDRDPSAWMLVTSFAPHIVVRVSANWSRFSGNNSCNIPSTFDDCASVLGKPLSTVLVGSKTETDVWRRFTSRLGSETDYVCHSLVTLHTENVLGGGENSPVSTGSYKPPSETVNNNYSHSSDDNNNNYNNGRPSSNNINMNSIPQQQPPPHPDLKPTVSEPYGDNYSLFSVHAYPIRTRTAVTVSTSKSKSSFVYATTRESVDRMSVCTNDITNPSGEIVEQSNFTSPCSKSKAVGGSVGGGIEDMLLANERDSITIAVPSAVSKSAKSSFLGLSSLLIQKEEQVLKRPVVLYAILFSELQQTSENLRQKQLLREEHLVSIPFFADNSGSNSRLKFSNTSNVSSKSFL